MNGTLISENISINSMDFRFLYYGRYIFLQLRIKGQRVVHSIKTNKVVEQCNTYLRWWFFPQAFVCKWKFSAFRWHSCMMHTKDSCPSRFFSVQLRELKLVTMLFSLFFYKQYFL